MLKCCGVIKGMGNLIEVFHAPNEMDEAEAVVKRIVKLRENAWIAMGRYGDFLPFQCPIAPI